MTDTTEPQTADEYIAQSRDIHQSDLVQDLTGARDAAVNAVVLMAQGAEGLDAADLKVMQALAESVYYLGVLAEHAADGELVDVTLREDELRDAFERIMAAKARSDA